MFKYSSINSYSLRNLHKSQIYFNNPLYFNDPFDTFHDAEFENLSTEKFIDFYSKTGKRKFDKTILKRILDKTISKEDFYIFCEKHAEYFIDFNDSSLFESLKSKKNFINNLKNIDEEEEQIIRNRFEEILFSIKEHLQETIKSSMIEIRNKQFRKIGVSCFSKTNDNLLMWSHYADSHKGFCLEFDKNEDPFSGAIDVIYQNDIPILNSDLLFTQTSETINKLLSYKSIDWQHEKELRVFHAESNKIYTYGTNALKSICFGLRTDRSDIEIVCSLIKSKNSKVKFYQMNKIQNKFKIEPIEFKYHTPIEIQSILITTISMEFPDNVFTPDELANLLILNIERELLQIYLEDLITKNFLIKVNEKYKMII